MNNYRDIFAGLFGGATSAILLLAANMGGMFSLLLFILVTFPIYVVTLGWGTRAGIASVVAALGILIGATSSMDAVAFGIMFFAIAAVLGHQANLAQVHPQDPNLLIWYPVSRLLFNLTWMAVVGVIIAGYLNNYSPERLEAAYAELLQQVLDLGNNPNLLGPDELKDMAKLYAGMMPFVLPALLLLVHVANLYLAANVVRRSGMLNRPRDDLPASLNLPMASVGAMAVGLIGLMVLSGVAAQILTVLAGASVTALALVGLASLHLQLRGKPAAPLILFLVYGACLIFMLPFYCFAIVGTIRVFSNQAKSRDGNAPPTLPPNGPPNGPPDGPPK